MRKENGIFKSYGFGGNEESEKEIEESGPIVVGWEHSEMST